MDRLALPLFILIALGGGALNGVLFPPGAWYAALEKPAFNPPDWLFAPVWTALYVLIGIAGWRVWMRGQDDTLRGLWVGQMALNLAWTPMFFGVRSPEAALGIILGLLAMIAAFAARAWTRDRTSAVLFLPYLAWVGFAALLNAAIVWLN